MPRLSDTMEEGVIVGWLKNVGDQVEPGDVLAEVETDKATMELENYHEGYLLHIGVKEGPVPVNGILAVIGEKGEDFSAALEAAQAESPTVAVAEGNTADQDLPVETKPAQTTKPEIGEVSSNGNPASDSQIKASPLARRLAREKGIDLNEIDGTGEHGRIIKRDVLGFTRPSGKKPRPSTSPERQTGISKELPISQMRKVIARRLTESKFGAPHFYVTVEIKMDETIRARKQLNAGAPPKISFNDIILKAVALSLRKHPEVNSSWMGDHIRQNGEINIGVAVAVPEGLVVPVIRHADLKSLSEINEEVRELAELAREKKIQPEQMLGNTFTISNLGMFAVDEFTAIINPPDAAILAVGSITQKPVVEDGKIEIGHLMKVTLSSDHRTVDGATAAIFLQTLRSFLEQPVQMLM